MVEVVDLISNNIALIAVIWCSVSSKSLNQSSEINNILLLTEGVEYKLDTVVYFKILIVDILSIIFVIWSLLDVE